VLKRKKTPKKVFSTRECTRSFLPIRKQPNTWKTLHFCKKSSWFNRILKWCRCSCRTLKFQTLSASCSVLIWVPWVERAIRVRGGRTYRPKMKSPKNRTPKNRNPKKRNLVLFPKSSNKRIKFLKLKTRKTWAILSTRIRTSTKLWLTITMR